LGLVLDTKRGRQRLDVRIKIGLEEKWDSKSHSVKQPIDEVMSYETLKVEKGIRKSPTRKRGLKPYR
jgi:hypothetical protein